MFGLRGKLILLASSVCLIPCLVFAIVGYTQTSENYLNTLENNLRVNAELKTKMIDNFVKEMIKGAEDAAQDPIFLENAGPGEIDPDGNPVLYTQVEIRARLQYYHEYWEAETIFLVDKNGHSKLNTDNIEANLSGRNYVNQALGGKSANGGVVVSASSGRPVFAVSSPILTNGRVTGAIVITRRIQDQVNALNQPYGYESRDSFLLNQDKVIMSEGRLSNSIINKSLDTPPSNGFSSPPVGSGRYINHNGTEVVGAWYISTAGWAIVEEVEKAEALVQFQQMITLLLGILAGMITIALVLTLFISGSIAKPIRQLAAIANRIAAGDLSTDNMVKIKGKDEVGKLGQAFNTMLSNMRELIAKVKQTAAELGEKSKNISVSSNEVAASNTEQANIAQEVSQAITELSKATEAIATNAHTARQSGDNAFKEARESSNAVREAIESLNAIKDAVQELGISSQQIGEIVSVIDDIADQTNLLALNAAIEAARAGEHGKSFTVVAEAVRNLAEKSSASTKEIAKLVGDTQQQIQGAVDISETGAGKANQAVGALDSIVNQIEAIANKIGEISAAGEQQAASSQEVTASMESLSAASEEVSASSQEMAGSAKLLSKLGQDLRNLVDQFTNV